MQLLYDLQLLAYQSDLTRIITFMYGREQTARPYPQVGVSEPHHQLTHHQNDPFPPSAWAVRDRCDSAVRMKEYNA